MVSNTTRNQKIFLKIIFRLKCLNFDFFQKKNIFLYVRLFGSSSTKTCKACSSSDYFIIFNSFFFHLFGFQSEKKHDWPIKDNKIIVPRKRFVFCFFQILIPFKLFSIKTKRTLEDAKKYWAFFVGVKMKEKRERKEEIKFEKKNFVHELHLSVIIRTMVFFF